MSATFIGAWPVRDRTRRPAARERRVEVAAVGEDHDRELVVREALDRRAEPDRLAVVPHPRVTSPGIEEPAEAVGHRLSGREVVAARGPRWPAGSRAVGECRGRERRLHRRWREQRARVQGLVPFRQISEGRVDAAVAERCGRRALIGLAEGIGLARVTEGAARHLVPAALVGERAVHAQRCEDALVQELPEGLAGDARDDQAQQHVARVAVGPARPRGKAPRLCVPQEGQHLARRGAGGRRSRSAGGPAPRPPSGPRSRAGRRCA